MIRAGSLCMLKNTTGFAKDIIQGRVGDYELFLGDGEIVFVIRAPFQDYKSSMWTFLCKTGIVYRIGVPIYVENWLKLL